MSNEQAFQMLRESLARIEDRQQAQGETLARVDMRTARTEAKVEKLETEMDTVQGQTKAALARVAELGRAVDADPSAQGWLWRSGPLAWLRRWPKPLAAILALVAVGLAYGFDVAVRAGVIQLGIPAGVLPQVGAGS